MVQQENQAMSTRINASSGARRRAPAKARLTARDGVAMDVVIRALVAHGGTITLRELVREVVDERNDAPPVRLTRRELTAPLHRLEPLGLRDTAKKHPLTEQRLKSAA